MTRADDTRTIDFIGGSAPAGTITRYPGGKNGAGVYQTIINHIPTHWRYVEAFAGSAAVYRRLRPAQGGAILIERDPVQVMALRDLASSKATILQGNALELLPTLKLGPDDFVYLDPPYHPDARRDPDLYTFELTAKDHARLLGDVLPALTAAGVHWALSGYRCDVYDQAAAGHGWHRTDYQAMTRRGVVTESLWTPYDPAAVRLHDHQFLGTDFRERERIARKVRRWADKLKKLPHHEQGAIMEALANPVRNDDGGPALPPPILRPPSSQVAVLFARADSVYKALPGCDVWDAERDARRWPGGAPIVAHPPCRAWGRLRYFAKPRPDEKDLALFAVSQVRRWGGVLEHPKGSSLWKVAGLPPPDGSIDEHGGWTLSLRQSWWGHRAEKETWLYIVGCDRPPPMPIRAGLPTHVVTSSARTKRVDGVRLRKGMPGWRPGMHTEEREHTPADFAAWLVELARRCRPVGPA